MSFCCRIAGSISSPNEDRLLKHLFDPQYQTNNVMTTPVNSSGETVNVTLNIQLRKLLDVVK